MGTGLNLLSNFGLLISRLDEGGTKLGFFGIHNLFVSLFLIFLYVVSLGMEKALPSFFIFWLVKLRILIINF